MINNCIENPSKFTLVEFKILKHFQHSIVRTYICARTYICTPRTRHTNTYIHKTLSRYIWGILYDSWLFDRKINESRLTRATIRNRWWMRDGETKTDTELEKKTIVWHDERWITMVYTRRRQLKLHLKLVVKLFGERRLNEYINRKKSIG